MPGFGLPVQFLVLAAAGYTAWFGVLAASFGFSVWFADPAQTVWKILPIVPFVLVAAAAVRELVLGAPRQDLTRAVRGVRISLLNTAVAAAVMAVGWLREAIAGSAGLLFGLVMLAFMFGAFFLPFLVVLGVIERRLRARARAGNPRWHPHLASTTQRGEAVVFFFVVLGSGVGAVVGLQHSLMTMHTFDADAISQVLAAGMVGMLFGFLGGAITGGLFSAMLSDRDLSRALPPVVVAGFTAGVLGTSAGPGWGVVTPFVAVCATAHFHGRRCRLFSPGCCQACGYALAGLGRTAPCPECGHG